MPYTGVGGVYWVVGLSQTSVNHSYRACAFIFKAMNKHPIIKVLNNLMFDKTDISSENSGPLQLSTDFTKSLKLLRDHMIPIYWIQQIEKSLHNLDRLERSSVLHIVLNEDLFNVVQVKTSFEIYPKHINISSFDLTKDGYKFVFDNLVCEVVTYLVYELIYKCIYNKISLDEHFLSQERYTTFCNLLSQPYKL
ncbi:hypothetical protein ACPDHJ_00775 [Myroides sp. C8-3]|uniref:hypothetical protein n=1 Tax=Myroides sp. C8-3 TaxID=3400533 RepID=UPI003D2F945C